MDIAKSETFENFTIRNKALKQKLKREHHLAGALRNQSNKDQNSQKPMLKAEQKIYYSQKPMLKAEQKIYYFLKQNYFLFLNAESRTIFCSAFSIGFCEFWCLFDWFRNAPVKRCSLFNFCFNLWLLHPLGLDGFPNATTLLSLFLILIRLYCF